MFPLAYRAAHTGTKQNFCIEDYLPNQNQRVATLIKSNYSYFWSLRSGHATTLSQTWGCWPSGEYSAGGYSAVSDTQGVRPAMVMKLQ